MLRQITFAYFLHLNSNELSNPSCAFHSRQAKSEDTKNSIRADGGEEKRSGLCVHVRLKELKHWEDVWCLIKLWMTMHVPVHTETRNVTKAVDGN